MEAKQTRYISSLLTALIALYAKWVRGIVVLAGLEARIARRSLFVLITLVLITLSTLITAWMFAMLSLFFWFASQNLARNTAAWISLVNFVLSFLCFFIMSKVKKNLSFPIVRQQISEKKIL